MTSWGPSPTPGRVSYTATSTPAYGRSIHRSPIRGTSPPPPGPARECNFGDNPLTPANDPFVCNNKLIGGAAFLDTYLSDPGRAAAEPFHTTRDSNGHGTHTASTSAGNALDSAPVLGVDRGPIHGLAPGAYVMEYKVCGIEGCFDSDASAAVAQAILDGVDVINFSISGGTDPYTDPVELSFLDAYAAGVFVSASAGNAGPGAGTANHLVGWVTTVAASTQTREFRSTLTVQSGGNTADLRRGLDNRGRRSAADRALVGAALQQPAVRRPGPPGLFDGKIVACRARRGSQSREGLQRPPGRRRGDGPLQPDAGRRGDRQPLAAHRPPRRRHRSRRLPQRQPWGDRQLHRRCSRRRTGRCDGRLLIPRPRRSVHQARRHRAGGADPGRAHPVPRVGRWAARPGSTSRRSPAPRCRPHTSPVRPSCCERPILLGHRARSSRPS